ncbi:hypothetical protein MA16_Dca011037 [Dendrobium catenatum]|uniref:Uncharacterized protein n=1 Tax=Dendrobium catenatum TaxID=906689 RepID=A0A2I0WCH0_9ASPA|nr:hypothetical protein MA16_Dca011037 [Dendrobium catenatum]
MEFLVNADVLIVWSFNQDNDEAPFLLSTWTASGQPVVILVSLSIYLSPDLQHLLSGGNYPFFLLALMKPMGPSFTQVRRF